MMRRRKKASCVLAEDETDISGARNHKSSGRYDIGRKY